jgi:hypothetical protein
MKIWGPKVGYPQYFHDLKLQITLSKSTFNIVCTVSLWCRGEGGRSWCFHTRNDAVSSSNMDRNVSWRCYRQKHWTTHLQGPRLVYVEGLRCHVLSFCLWVLLVYRGIHCKRRNRLSQELVERLLHTPEPEPEVCEKVLLFILFSQTYLDNVSQVPVEGRDTHMRETERDRERDREKERETETL